MSPGWAVAFAVTAIVAALGTRLVLEVAHCTGRLDMPNVRSAHIEPTPRLGGLGIMAAFLPAGVWVVGAHGGQGALVLAATAFISAVGLVDDLHPLSARVRLGAQCLAAALVVGAGWENLGSAWTLLPGVSAWLIAPLSVLWIVWLTNLYNFMDGIDGLAGGQTVIGGMAIAFAAAGATAALPAALSGLAAAAALGFLILNFPPASIFMGDVGSTAIGFLFAALPFIGGSRGSPIPVEVISLALALFIMDATFTLFRRMWRRERLAQAHRSHVYQRPLALGVSHRAITLTSYCGMSFVGAEAVLYGRLAWPGRILLFLAALAIFALLARWVGRLEARSPVVSEQTEQ